MSKADIKSILEESKIVAVVGLSPKEERDSHRVAKYLQSQGYRIIPVNPNADEVLGERRYPNLASSPLNLLTWWTSSAAPRRCRRSSSRRPLKWGPGPCGCKRG